MFKESTRSRQPAHLLAILVVGGVAVFSSQVEISPWALSFFYGAFMCGLFGYLGATRQELIADEAGLRWGPVGKPATVSLAWSRIRLVRSAEWDRPLQIGTSGSRLWPVPAYFLRSDAQRDAFLTAVKCHAPDTALEGFPKGVLFQVQPHPAEPAWLG